MQHTAPRRGRGLGAVVIHKRFLARLEAVDYNPLQAPGTTRKMKRRAFLSTSPFLAAGLGTLLGHPPAASGGQRRMSTSCTLVEPGAFTLTGNASLAEGQIRFADESSCAWVKLKLSSGRGAQAKLDPHDAGYQPSSGRYYVYAKCSRDRTRPASVRVGRQVAVAEYTGELKGMLWEKFTPFVVRRTGEVRLSLRLGAGATLERALVLREPYPYWIVQELPEKLRGQILDDLRRLVLPPGVRKVDSGVVMNFEPGDRDIHCMAWDGKHVWCGFSLGPSRALRVNPADLSTKRVVFRGCGGLHHFAFDGEWVWAVHMPRKLSRIDPATGKHRTFAIDDRSGGGYYCSTFDGERLWIGVYSRPTCAVAIDRSGKLVRRVEIPDTPYRCFRSILFDGRAIWGGLLTRPGKLVRIDPATGALEVYPLRPGEDNINSLCWDGRYIWAGLETRPARIVRFDPRTRTHDTTPLNEGEDFCRTVVPFRGHIYAALYCTPATVVKLTQDMRRVGAWRLGPGEDHARAAVHDGKHLWVGLAMNRWDPSQLWRLDR